MSAEIVWADPPPHGNSLHASKYEPFADALRERPGQWAVFPGPYNTSLTTRITRGKYPAFPAGEFEAVSRGGAVYVRYVGDKS